jgi:hypothetical protein
MSTKEFSLWEKEDVISWLESNKLPHIDAFRRSDLSGYDLCYTNLEDLKSDLLVNSLHERNRIMRQIKFNLLELCKTF